MLARQKHCHGIAIARKRMHKEGKMRIFVGLLVGLSIGALFLSPTWAYNAVNHDRATDPALAGRVSADAMEAIKKANKAVDDDPNYDPRAHFDRDPTKTSDQCFRESVKHVQDKKAEAIALIKACNNESALKAIGEALHAIQDFYAHSNYVDLTDAEQKTLRDAFENPDIMDAAKVALPGNLRLAAYYGKWSKYGWDAYNPSSWGNPKLIPGFIEEKDPRDQEPFDHGLIWGKHKDVKPREGPFFSPNPGDGSRKITRNGVTKTAFDWSMEAAQKHSKEFIDQIIQAVGQDLWNKKFLNYKFPTPAPIPPIVPKPRCYPPSYPYITPYQFRRPVDSTYEELHGVFGSVPPDGGILDDGHGTAVFTYSGTVPVPIWFYILYASPDIFPVNGLPSGVKIFKIREFWPDGGEFQRPVRISMMYDPSEVQGVEETSLKIYEFDLYNDATWNAVPSSTLDMANRTVTFQTTCFTIYGIGGFVVPVGGLSVLIDKPKPDSSAPYIGLASTILVAAVATAVYVKRVKHRKEKQ
jgi:hypothetical protein